MKNSIIESLEWRYAVKKYNSAKIISDSDMDILKESIRLTPTSYGLQPFQVLIIEDKEIRKQLLEKSFGQTPVLDASHLIVFAANRNININHVDDYMGNVAKTRKLKMEQTKGFGDFIKGAIAPMTENDFISWNTKQTYIALGFLMHTAAELRIDATPMEGFNSAGFDEILGLTERGLTSTIICPVGYRSTEDKNQFQAKVRKEQDDLFISI
jgi:nitroreductase|tara:strand:+ start:2037 stop:2672 length:636 start_codon:yes stop_codon:yes gene_type:complete